MVCLTCIDLFIITKNLFIYLIMILPDRNQSIVMNKFKPNYKKKDYDK